MLENIKVYIYFWQRDRHCDFDIYFFICPNFYVWFYLGLKFCMYQAFFAHILSL